MGARVLIVEDELIVAEDLFNKVTQLGHEVLGTASSGEEAVRMAAALQPNLVLMDVRLEGAMTGLQAARYIQSMAGIPVVYITAYSEVFLREPDQMASPGLCISKPFSVEQLQAVLDVTLSAQVPPPENQAHSNRMV